MTSPQAAAEASGDCISPLGGPLSFKLVNPTKETYRARIKEAENEITLREEEISSVKQTFRIEITGLIG